ncbi:MAG: hypothetical protein PHU99_06315 [Candidatus Cloacimonetes bacterium]|nr:hypothetical protein [Candidatus Cloacimonadota bacterium]MDY0337561.1 hypothetical protein [Candidatus Cloacimonadaceae bacterium]MCB5268649.1 hypothetical protein [Candidatus Cloacimonadota bacterium]MCK9335237.1 hypothetical protein [Candidatus Cloacimonadota bacterium]MDD2544375.1 hypothetical protein [Candidatus Cloacimonadota bacterium]
MCPNEFSIKCGHLSALVPVSAFYGVILLLFIFTLLPNSVFAQIQSEDYSALKTWKLPENAIPIADLTEQEGRLMLDDKLFSGWAFERYPEGHLLQAVQYLNGLQHGLNLLWYPDGAPQMSANYQRGYLHGRFLGWYANGNVIYDMFINRGTYATDNLSDGDDGRLSSETEIFEGEGRDNDNTSE